MRRRRNRSSGVGGANHIEIAVCRVRVKFASGRCSLANVLPKTVASVVKTVLRARSGLTMAAPFAAPPTAFNASITAHRNVAYAQLDLEDIKTVKNHFGVKVNDVVMALVSGVLRQFLLDRGELPDSSLVAMVPVSVHGQVGSAWAQSGFGNVLQPGDADRRSGGTDQGHRRSEFRCQGT